MLINEGMAVVAGCGLTKLVLGPTVVRHSGKIVPGISLFFVFLYLQEAEE